jgi:hypothetical protein
MSRLPLRDNLEPPADPIDVDIPVDLVTENRSPQPFGPRGELDGPDTGIGSPPPAKPV